MAFEQFTQVGKSFHSKASISNRGIIGFTNGARNKYDMGSYKSAILYFDNETNKVGIELKPEEQENAIKLRLRDTGADIFAKSFFDYFRINIDKTKSFDLTKDDQTGYLIIDLSSGRERKTKEVYTT
jgi:hypothetical protein